MSVNRNNQKISNQPSGGGNKLQGLAPKATHYFKSLYTGRHYSTGSGDGKNRNVVFSMNQLGGIGRARSQFGFSADGSKYKKPDSLQYQFIPLEQIEVVDTSNSTNLSGIYYRIYVDNVSSNDTYNSYKVYRKNNEDIYLLYITWDSNEYLYFTTIYPTSTNNSANDLAIKNNGIASLYIFPVDRTGNSPISPVDKNLQGNYKENWKARYNNGIESTATRTINIHDI